MVLSCTSCKNVCYMWKILSYLLSILDEQLGIRFLSLFLCIFFPKFYLFSALFSLHCDWLISITVTYYCGSKSSSRIKADPDKWYQSLILGPTSIFFIPKLLLLLDLYSLLSHSFSNIFLSTSLFISSSSPLNFLFISLLKSPQVYQ